MQETIKPINHSPGYFISDSGNVFSEKYGRRISLKQSEHKGYRRVALSSNNKRKIYPVHRLVLEAFIPNLEEKPFINHKDGNRKNNWVENLEWCTAKENMKHRREVLGDTGAGKDNPNYGYRKSRFYPNPELRNRLLELGIPYYKHDIVSLGEMLPDGVSEVKENGEWNILWEEPLKGWSGNEADLRAKMLVYLLENKLIKI